jgi:transposase
MTHTVKEAAVKQTTIKNPATIGLDLAKSIMHLHALDEQGSPLWKKTLKTDELVIFLEKLEPCLIGIEACGGSHHWYRTLSSLGHTIHMISPQRVKAFVEGQKNDKNDAVAIANAVINRQTRIVPPRTIRQQEIGSLHTMRGLKIKQRTQIINHMRGMMNEYGISCRTGAIWFESNVSELINKAEKDNTFPKLIVEELLIQVKDLEIIKERIQNVEKHLLEISTEDKCKRLKTIPGIGFLISTMLYGYAGNVEYYKTGRDFAASLGLIPRQYSTGGKQIYGRISKRGNIDLRANLVQGARTVIMGGLKRRKNGNSSSSSLMDWALRCYDRKGINKAGIAVANKIARIAWKILKTEGMTFVPFKPDKEKESQPDNNTIVRRNDCVENANKQFSECYE